MSLSAQRIQDPILTELAQGYYNAELVCEKPFPGGRKLRKRRAKSRSLGV